jgi:hypothetical protein
VSLDACVFALRLEDASLRRELERRLDALAALYEPLGTGDPVLRWTAGGGVAVGALVPGGAVPPGETLAWGAAPPPGFDPLTADEAALRRLDGPTAVVAAGADRAVAVAAAGGTASLFAADGPHGQAWSSHAVAAAWLAGLRPSVDAGAVPELLAAEHLGGDRTLIASVRAVPQATAVDIRAGGARASCFWPAAERWQPVPEPEAAALAERDLLESLSRRLHGAAAPVLGLTAGLDSRAALVAMRELGLTVRAFTFGDAGSEDAAGAAAAARALGVEHEVADFDWWPDEPGLAMLRAEACWFDGARPAGFGDVAWPAMSHWLAGVGGETGRAFLYRWCRPDARREPSPADLARVLHVQLGERLVGADPAVRAGLRARWRAWVDEAQDLGARGWRTLDVVYSEHRVRRWGRATLPRVRAAPVPAFATPELQRALASLSLEDRLTDGFARRFIAARAPALATPAPEPPRRALVAPLAARRARQSLRGARRSLRLPRPSRGADPWFTHPPWVERPLFLEWLSDAVLASPLLEEPVGKSWLRATRDAFLRGDPAAGELAMSAASIVALDEGLRELCRLESVV